MQDITKFKQLIAKIGRLQVFKFPNDESAYNFWNFDDNEQELKLEKMPSIDENENDDEDNENLAENLMLLEVSTKLIDDKNLKNTSSSFDFDALLEDYEASRKERSIKVNENSAAKENGNLSGDIFSQAIKELNLYEEENNIPEEKIEQPEEFNSSNSQEKSRKEKKENRHVIFNQTDIDRDSENEMLTDSSLEDSSSSDSDDADEKCDEPGLPANNSHHSSYQAYDQYAAQNYQQWRNIFDFQMANIQNYVKFQK